MALILNYNNLAASVAKIICYYINILISSLYLTQRPSEVYLIADFRVWLHQESVMDPEICIIHYQ
jgi:hypothetical protein